MKEQKVYVFGGFESRVRQPELEVRYQDGRGVYMVSGDAKIYVHYDEMQEFAKLMQEFAVQAMADRLTEDQNKIQEEFKWSNQSLGAAIGQAKQAFNPPKA